MAAGLALIAGSAVWLVLSGQADIRYTADHAGTVPMWHSWIPALAGLTLIRLLPLRAPPAEATPERAPYLRAVVLLVAAVAFAVALRLSGGGEPTYTLLKTSLLLAVPLLLFLLTPRDDPGTGGLPPAWRRFGPVVPVAVWLVLMHVGPLALPRGDFASFIDPVTLLITVVVVFAVNALLEEVFYRRWLQTRWERVLGRWPAIVLTSLLWAAWHIGIQGTGHLLTDLASSFANQGVTGLFLGYLWSRYRLMWPILVVHGTPNALPALLGMWP